MQKKEAFVKQFSWWSWCILGLVLLMVLPAYAQVVRRTSQTKVKPSHHITGGLISIRPLSTWSGGYVPRAPQVSIMGNQIHIETYGPAVIEVKPLQEPPAGKSELGRHGERARASRVPIIMAPTP
jgi:hypothetical protein